MKHTNNRAALFFMVSILALSAAPAIAQELPGCGGSLMTQSQLCPYQRAANACQAGSGSLAGQTISAINYGNSLGPCKTNPNWKVTAGGEYDSMSFMEAYTPDFTITYFSEQAQLTSLFSNAYETFPNANCVVVTFGQNLCSDEARSQVTGRYVTITATYGTN
jgi:hypothetical protein